MSKKKRKISRVKLEQALRVFDFAGTYRTVYHRTHACPHQPLESAARSLGTDGARVASDASAAAAKARREVQRFAC